MDLAQKAVNVLYMLRDYAPVALVLALAVLPYELSAHNASSTSSADLASLGPALRVHRALLLLAWFCNKLWYLVFYSHIGLSRVWNFQSNEIWAAPCESQSQPLITSHAMSIRLAQEGAMTMNLRLACTQIWLTDVAYHSSPQPSILHPSTSAVLFPLRNAPCGPVHRSPLAVSTSTL